MSLEKKDNSPQRKPIKKLSKLGSRKPADAPKRVIEQVPDWLLQLLGKHGEAPGPLIGLEEPTFARDPSQADDLDEEAAQISALLEQMEEEGLPQDVGQRASTSVEWGPYDEDKTEIPPGPIDDLLDSLSDDEEGFLSDALDQDDDWLAGSVSQAITSDAGQDDPYSNQTADDQPDWLTDLIPSDKSKPAVETTFSDSEDTVPDWLNDALETPAQFDAEETDSTADFPTDSAADYEVPDWLTDALDQPAETPTGEVDVPDWLTDALDEPAAPAKPTGDIGSVDDDVPDWLSQPTSQSIIAEADKLPAVESTPDDIPDWLEETIQPDTLPAGSETAASETDTPDWLQDQSDEPADETDIPDWLTGDDASSAPPAPEPEVAATDDIPDWLAADIEPQSSEDPAATQAAAFDWLSDLRDSVSDDSPEAEAISSDVDAEEWPAAESDDDLAASSVDSRLDWLEEMNKAAAAEAPAEPSTEHPTPPDTSWLHDLEPSPDAETEAESEPSLETMASDDTDWLYDLEPPPDAEPEIDPSTERITPPGTGWLRDLEPPPGSQDETEAETSAERVTPPGTGWLRDLEPPPSSQGEEPATTSETTFETDDDED
ncbi:MAG: hypothetical protein KDI02_08790, partial [Anaerolineae bacterium]|nr:hypothetical protein [Anaerolineae bacterium]